jgi:nitroreductase
MSIVTVSERPRRAEASVDEQFISRWSPRSFSSEALNPELLSSLFEAARWAPSAANAQPWLFIYADDAEALSRFRALLRGGNRRWAERAPVLAFLFARKHNQGAPNRSALFDAGAAWMALALQARKLGIVTRAMGGILRDEVYPALGVPADEYDAACAIAIGRQGQLDVLPSDLQERERPNDRRPLAQIAVRGRFPG